MTRSAIVALAAVGCAGHCLGQPPDGIPLRLQPAGHSATVQDLVKSLNALGTSPRDLVSILQAMKAAGALDADLEVM